MPELPEVETVRLGLAPEMEGMRIERLELRRPDLRFPLPLGLADEVAGRDIVSLGRRAKYLLIDLDNGRTIISHLGMSGSFRVERNEETAMHGLFHHERSKDERHDHVIFHLSSADRKTRVIYNDPRRFGFMDIADRARLAENPFFLGLGPEPTGNALSAGYMATRFRDKKQPLKSALLDQRVIAGLGNIYVCEALWRAELSPLRPAGTIVTRTGAPTARLRRLEEDIRAVIADAIAAGGSSLRDHIRTDGSLGYFQHSFSVYDREGSPCPRPGCGGSVERIVQAGRSTFYCASCQR